MLNQNPSMINFIQMDVQEIPKFYLRHADGSWFHTNSQCCADLKTRILSKKKSSFTVKLRIILYINLFNICEIPQISNVDTLTYVQCTPFARKYVIEFYKCALLPIYGQFYSIVYLHSGVVLSSFTGIYSMVLHWSVTPTL